MSEWVKITARTPSKHDFYLVLLPGLYGHEGTIVPAYFGAHFDRYEGWPGANRKWCRVTQNLYGTPEDSEIFPTHYMKMPKAPK